MTREFSLAHFTLLDCSPPELARVAARAGYDFIGLRLIPLDRSGEPRYPLAEDRQLREETRRALSDTGIRLLDIELAQITEGLDPRTYLPVLETAADLGARFLLTTVWTPNRSVAIECFSGLCDVAQPLGLTVMLEFVSFADVATLAAATDILHASGRPNAGILVDVLHCHLARTPLDELQQVPSSWLPYAHICDAPAGVPPTRDACRQLAREQRLLPGEGVIDLRGILSRLPATTILAIEAPNPARARALGAQEYARRCLAAARNCTRVAGGAV